MDEAAAKRWLAETLAVSRETFERLDAFVRMLREENGRQNLVSSASLEHIYVRHIVDSAQLVMFAPKSEPWLDLGSGAGFPGLIIAILRDTAITLIESRRLRSDWLRHATETLGLDNATIVADRVERASLDNAAVITARAFATLPKLFALGHRFSDAKTVWLLPKGRSGVDELASSRGVWHCDASMQPSVTNPHSAIIIARNVRPVRAV